MEIHVFIGVADMPMMLVPAAGGRPIPLDKAIVFLGRGQECDVVLTNSRKVSRKHCCVAQIDDRFVVRDLGSMNGVRINGELVDKEGEFRIGDELAVGDQVFRLQAINKVTGQPVGKSPGSGSASVQPQSPPPPAHQFSGHIPVILPEEEEDFAVEETGMKLRPVDESDDQIVQVSELDFVDDEEDFEIDDMPGLKP